MKIQRLTTLGVLTAILVASGNQLWAATLHVSQTSANPTPPYATWDTAAHTIQEAVDAASDGDTVLVAAGEYRPSAQGTVNLVNINKAIVLRSESGPGQTTINASWDPAATRCLWMSNSLAVVEGFTMIRGTWTGNDLAAGVVMVGGVLKNCTVTRAGGPWREGRFVYCSGGGLITDCHIDGNHSNFARQGGGVYLIDSELRNSSISDMFQPFWYSGALEGAGVYAVSSTISGCVITNNTALHVGGGAYLDRCVMDRCIIAGNQAGQSIIDEAGWGGGVFATNSVIRNSLIAGNGAHSGYPSERALPGFGGGIYLQEGRLVNCTVTANGAQKGGGIHIEAGLIRNSIVYFNPGSSNNWYNAGGGVFDHTCTTPDPGGIGNIADDPKFLDHTNRNYRLAAASPCIDAGVNESWMSGAQDVDGNPRIYNNGIVDIGAYESPHTAPVSNDPVISLSDLDPEAFETLSDTGIIRFNRTGDPAQEIEVHWTFSGSAGNGSDFQQLPTSSPFPNGNEAFLTITPIDDTDVEDTETVTVTLLDGPGYRVGSPSTATVTIIDNESDEPVISLSDLDPEAFEEGSDTGVIRFSRTGNPLQEIEVYWTFSGTAVNGSDFEQLPTNSPFPVGSDAYLTITPIDDAEGEGSETVTVTLVDGPGYRVGARNSQTVIISDNDP